MWYYSLTVCIAFACLLCSSASGFSSSDYDSSSSSQFSSDLRKARRDPRWMLEDPSFLFDKRTGIDVGTWPESEAVSSLSRQLFGDKAADSSAEQLLEEDLSVVGKKGKRGESHSLSIVNPLDVLRQRLLLDMARRRMKENQKQISENAAILHQLGKRANDRRIQVSSSENFEV